ncbi:MAG: LPS biosynthesis glycosyltransferase, partial [Candidatus Electrothrix sp. AW3_4]|nr:LPS biosynthesis glycosyltransferase [Candidatus Electrothrix gigas]
TSYFGKIYIINLPHRTDRLQETKVALNRAGIPSWIDVPEKVEIFSAITKEAPGLPTGCFLSHLAVLKKALEHNLPNVLILEDDVEFCNAFLKYWPSILTQLMNQSWDFAYLGYSHVARTQHVSRYTKSVEMRRYQNSGLRCTHAYAVNASILQSLIQYLEETTRREAGDPEGGAMSLDGAYSMFRLKNPDTLTLISVPQVAWQRASHSDLHSNWLNSSWLMQILLRPVRKAKNWMRRWIN